MIGAVKEGLKLIDTVWYKFFPPIIKEIGFRILWNKSYES
jgi:hypothetical protein